MSKRLCVACLSFCLVYLALSTAQAGAVVRSCSEDFSSKQYCDTLNTTAWWDTVAGELKLPEFELTLAGSYDTPGDADRVAISGDHAYVADRGSGLQVINISDPTTPALAGSYDTPGTAYGVAISGDYAYVGDFLTGLQVIDISDPTTPVLAGSYNTPGTARGVAISGDYAYVADGTSGLQVIDISDPTTPVSAGSYNTPGTARGVTISGDYAYVGDGYYGLQVIDISDPTTPALAGSYYTPDAAYVAAISGDYAYVAVLYSGLQVIDISDPTTLTLAGSYDTPGGALDVAISGDYAYVADYTSDLQVIDISDPTAPTLAGSYDTPDWAWGVAISGDHAYVADYRSGLQVIRIAEPVLPPVTAGSWDTPGGAYRIAISGDYAYVADHGAGLQVIDISDPTNPALAGSYDTYYAKDVAISGDYAYVADAGSGLQVIAISDPTNPAFAGSYDTPGSAHGVAISGDYAYIADLDFCLQVINISDPTNPALAGSCYTPSYARSVAISGDYAYVADDYAGLQVVDISDPTNPALAGSKDTPDKAYGVAISGDYAYVADAGSGLQVIDISDPKAPAFAGSYFTFDWARDVAIAGDYAYVAAGFSGLLVIDLSDTTLTLAGSYDTPGTACGVTISGDYAYVADADWGLQVVQVFQRRFDTGSNTAWSLSVGGSDETIVRARLSSTQTDSVRWEVSADSGGNWQEFLPGVDYQNFTSPGGSPIWRSSHFYTGLGTNPTCSNLEIEWLYEFGVIDSIVDFPNDQGGWVCIYFTRSGLDFADELEYPIATYVIYRRIDEAALRSRVVDEGEPIRQDRLSDLALGSGEISVPLRLIGARLFNLEGRYFVVFEGTLLRNQPPGIWEVVGSVSARQENQYIFLAPALADSSEALRYSAYCISAQTTTDSVYYFSPPDSGYSVDNLAPAAPLNLTMASATDLVWDECPDDDFDYFTVYGSAAPGLDTTAVLVGYTIEATMDVTDDQYNYYHVTATDFAGNEGDASSAENTYAGVSVEENLPVVFALKPNRPNPFRSGTVIRFDLPDICAVRLEVVDVQGRVVRVLAEGAWPGGRHSVVWTGENDAGEITGPGVYFARIKTGDFTATNKMLRMK